MQMGHQSYFMWPFVGHLFNAFSTKFVIFFFGEQNIVVENEKKNFFHEDDFFIVSNVSLLTQKVVPQWVELSFS